MEAGEILFNRGLLSEQQLEATRGAQSNGARLDQIAVELGFVSEEQVLRALGDEVGIDYLDLTEVKIDLSLLEDFPQRFIHRYSVFPIERNDGSVVVATSNPFDLYPLDEISAATGMAVVPVLADKDQIAKLIKSHLGVGSETIDGLLARQSDNGVELLESIDADGADLSDQAYEASVIRLVNEILVEALESRASDVHIESQPSGLRIRYRIDGMLHSQPVPPEIGRFQAAIISRLKIMARLNIAEKRMPQDGRIKLRICDHDVDVRVSVIPMLHGEGIVMRLLDKSRMEFALKKLGMSDDIYRRYSELIRQPHGIVLATGPTGSGKTTTLYSSLLDIKSDETKIITTEDPVEYQLDGINQIQVHTKIGLSFAHSLRSILRHDPDIILVGEIRDFETAENAIQASLTGHLVFSTLHTNDAAGAYTRLVDMGVEPFLVASTVDTVMAQRLVRRLCTECRQSVEPRREDLPADFPWEEYRQAGQPLYQAAGCRACREFGYSGRQGIFELLATTDRIRQLARDRASTWELRNAALEEGMLTLRDDAWRKVLEGSTSVEEALRVTKGDVVPDV